MSGVEAVNAALWRSARRGVLEAADRLERVGFVVGQGVILLPAPASLEPGTLEDAVLWVPDEGEESLAVQVEIRLLEDETSGHARLIDRWEAYHGRRGAARFAVCGVSGARLGGMVIDGDDLRLVNTLGNEGALLRRLNADKLLLAQCVRERLGVDVHEPTAVGVDQRGIDVRTRTGVVRLGVDGGVMNDGEAAELVEGLLGGVKTK
ncbi:MAG: hypothetical protein QM783_03570 [Phycisphaerales bacterium]